MREQVKKLWKLCFNDSDEFTEMYFRLRYNNEVNIAIQSGEEVIAALQILPYPMTFGGKEISTGYVSGACTHPDYRNRGAMRELLSQAFARMQQNGVAVSTLIPAEPWLFDYYAGTGYAPVFKYASTTFTASDKTDSNETVVLEKANDYQEDIYSYLNRKMRERPYCIQHTETDFRVILSDLQLSKGHVYTLNQSGRILALAIAYPAGSVWHVGEIVAETPDMRTLLLQRICKLLHIPSIQVSAPPAEEQEGLQPLGMARIINAKEILQQYAAGHPELEMSIALTDQQLSTNSGYYYLNNGKCMSSAKRLPGRHLALTIGELAEKILSPLHPYMSLMLN
ncbi:GNAT family N-acetyltransferase [Bacteroides eggerthii]|jgi:predicted acetyltransferase|uniref:GNAT family N-acetyltransferase n=1 Tax=Bacteroides eggerthii TaxID=28111 RepID=UPI0022E80E65|nr:GNAT family N-acetyltransferase [Bacteroides eggerthii]